MPIEMLRGGPRNVYRMIRSGKPKTVKLVQVSGQGSDPPSRGADRVKKSPFPAGFGFSRLKPVLLIRCSATINCDDNTLGVLAPIRKADETRSDKIDTALVGVKRLAPH